MARCTHHITDAGGLVHWRFDELDDGVDDDDNIVCSEI